MATSRPSASGYSVLGTFSDIAASQTDATLIPGTPRLAIRVHSLAVTAGTATTCRFISKDGPSGTGTNISAAFYAGANGGAVLPYNSAGWFETSRGSTLGVTTSSGGSTGYTLTYSLVD